MQDRNQVRNETGQQVADLRGRLVAFGADEVSLNSDVECLCGSRASEVISTAPPFNPIVMGGIEGRSVFRSPEHLRLHPALIELGWIGEIAEVNGAERLKNQFIPEPILITKSGIILAGFGRWRSAVSIVGTKSPALNIPSARMMLYSSYSSTTKPGVDGMLLSVFAWR
jgi:hypothetical protein